MKQNRLLRDEADCLAQAHLRDLGDILPVDQNPAAVEVVKPLQQLDEGRLAGAGRPDKTHSFPRPDLERETFVETETSPGIAE